MKRCRFLRAIPVPLTTAFKGSSAKELGPFNITVNAIGPTPMDMGLIKGIPDQWLENVVNMQTIKRHGKLKDITHTLDFLISDDADFITGQVIYLGGIS